MSMAQAAASRTPTTEPPTSTERPKEVLSSATIANRLCVALQSMKLLDWALHSRLDDADEFETFSTPLVQAIDEIDKLAAELMLRSEDELASAMCPATMKRPVEDDARRTLGAIADELWLVVKALDANDADVAPIDRHFLKRTLQRIVERADEAKS